MYLQYGPDVYDQPHLAKGSVKSLGGCGFDENLSIYSALF